MNKLLVLNLHGDFATGFDVNWEIGPDGQRPSANGMSSLALPPCPDLEQVYQNWRDPYRQLDGSRIKQKSNQITNVRYTDLISECKQTAGTFANLINDWFDSSPLSKTICTDLLTNFEDEYRVIICTDRPQVRQIPWQLWAGWEKFQHLEISLGAPYTQRRDRIYQQQVRVLVILGSSEGINIEADRQIIEGYRQTGAYLEFLAQPTIDELRQQLLDQRGWDIISFSGHSRTESNSSGRIFLNHTDSLTMAELRAELTTAIEKGLQLAIFNSCDGLGIAAELESLYIPQVIVMRQPVPDRVAQDFLKYFLAEFTSGQSLYRSVSMARENLKKLETEFPCASWLPIIIQNRFEIPPTWQSLGSIPKCPYRGLAAFREEDREYFYGRKNFTQTLVQAVNSQPIVPIIGASGSGKSSVVFAGLIPLLRQEREHPWLIISLRPGNAPVKALAIGISSLVSAQANPKEYQNLESELVQNVVRDEFAVVNFLAQQQIDRRLLIVIDQFEELYTLEIPKSDRVKFLQNILNSLDRFPNLKLLFTLRADCYKYLLEDTVLVTALASINNKLLTPMSRSELTEAIVIPAQKLNVRFEEGLIEKILDSVFTSDNSLPLLEFAMTQLWEKQQNGYLTHRADREIGGVEKALTNHAEAIFTSLTPSEQEKTRTIMIQLVKLDRNSLPTRRIAKRSEIGANNWQLINHLAAGRLVVTDWDGISQQETVELIHEALISHWQTFQLWIELDGEFRHWQEQLRSAISQWQKSDRDESGLLRGKSLDTARDWLTKYSPHIGQLEREFIDLSLTKQQQVNTSKKRLQLSIIIGLVSGLIVVSFFWHQAEEKRRLAVSSNITSLSNNAELLFKNHNELDALRKAVEAGKLIQKEGGLSSEITLPAIATLGSIIEQIHERKILAPDHQGAVNSVAYSQDGNTIVSVGNDGQLNIYDRNGKIIQPLSVSGNKYFKVLISKDGQSIITASNTDASNTDSLTLWQHNSQGDWSKQKPLPVGKHITALDLSPKSQSLVVALHGGGVKLYQYADHVLKEDRTLPINTNIKAIKFTPDGQRIIALDAIDTITIWSESGQLNTPIKAKLGKQILSLAISPDGDKIATGDATGHIYLWDIQSKKRLDVVEASKTPINDLNFSNDSQLLASAGEDKAIKILKIKNRSLEVFEILSGHSESVQSVNFSPDGKMLVSGSQDRTARLWQVHPLNSQSNEAVSFSYSPDGELLAFANPKGNVTIFDRKQQKTISSFQTNHDREITEISVSADHHIATIATVAGNDAQVKLWTIDGKAVQTPKPLTGIHCTFSSNGSILAIATKDNQMKIYDVDSRQIESWPTKQAGINHLSFTAVGSTIITGDTTGLVKLWNLKGDELVVFPKKSSDDPILDVSYHPGRDIMAIASRSKVSLIFRDGHTLLLPEATGIDALTFSRDGAVLVTGNDKEALQLWNLKGELLKTIQENARLSYISKVRFGGSDRELMALFNIDQKTISHNLNLEQLLKQADDWLKYSHQ